MIYFGTKGRLIPVKCPSVQRVTDDDRYRFATTLEGKRKAQIIPGHRRVWDLTLGDVTTQDQVAVLRDFAAGAWGSGPFLFVPEEAPSTNMLPPGVASCDPAAGMSPVNEADGPLLTDEGWAPRSVTPVNPPGFIHFGGEYMSGAAPVSPGIPITASAYVTGDNAGVQVSWRDEDWNYLSSVSSSVRATASTVVRSHVTASPPAQAAWASVRAINAIRGSRPALTWTDRLAGFSDGRIAQKVVVDQTVSDLVYTTDDRTYQNLSFTVTEVG